MKNLLRVSLALALGGAVAVLPGCGGGGTGYIAPNGSNVAQYQGTYDGQFNGTIAQGLPGAGTAVSGTLRATVDNNGNVTGSFLQPALGIGSVNVTGTVSPSGQVAIVSAPYSVQGLTQVSTLSGNVTLNGGNTTASGSFTTKTGAATVATGNFSATRVTNGG